MKPEKAEARRQGGAAVEESGQNLEGANWRANDILMEKASKKIGDERVLKLIRR